MRFTQENIETLAAGEIFIFGSNLSGRHDAGAAKKALEFGAVMGKGVGFKGRTYAIPTKDENIRTMPTWNYWIFIRLVIITRIFLWRTI